MDVWLKWIMEEIFVNKPLMLDGLALVVFLVHAMLHARAGGTQ